MFRNLPTLKSLPQAIGLPFLSSHEDAQVAFKAGAGGIKRLCSEQTIPISEDRYWAQYWTVFNSAADVYSLISAQDVRQALQANPTNVANLIQVLSQNLFTLLPSSSFPSSISAKPGVPSPTTEALNCLRVLGRVLTIVYEQEGEGSALGGATFADKYLWSRQRVKKSERILSESAAASAGGGLTETQFTIVDDSDDEDEAGENDITQAPSLKAVAKASMEADPSSEAENSQNGGVHDPLSNPVPGSTPQLPVEDDDTELSPSLADRLFSCTIDLLFCAGFTVPDSVRGDSGMGDKINYVIWEKGVGSTVSVGSTAEMDRNKVEVLRFLLVLVSSTLYSSPNSLQTARNPPLEHLTHQLERRLVLSLLCSLLNTSLAASQASALPYNHLLFKASDERRTLVRTCLMTLLVVLDYRSFDTIVPPGNPLPDAKDNNAFRFFLSKLHRKDDFAFILGGILGILEEHVAVQNRILPGSKQPVPYVVEAFMLLWRIVDINKRFRTYLFESGKAIDVIGYILLCCLEFKNDPSQHGFLRLLAYLLQTLSADAGFAQAINQPVRQTIPAKWAVQGSAADFMIVSIYSIATTPGLNPLFPALTIAIANIAPNLHHIGVQASTRLLQLFRAFSAPNFLLADEGHPRLVYYLLETFNSVLYHQLNENPNLVYAILRSHQDFQTLATFTLMSGLREIQRRKALKAQVEEQQRSPTPSTRGLVRTNSELAMLAEKAALLGREIDEEGDGADHIASPAPTEAAQAVLSDHAEGGDTTATSAAGPASSASRAMSEKARGKMRATESTTSLPLEDAEEDEELLKVAAAGVGPNGYVPTQEWVSSWQKGLPLDPVLVAISELLPKIQDSQPATKGGPSSKVFNLLKGASLEDVLPPAPPILPRKFAWTAQSCVWLTSLLWGDIYVANLTPGGAWRDTSVRLFGVKQAPAKRGVQGVFKMLGVA